VFPNPFDREFPRVTLRSYLRLLNFKANHRKVLITDAAAGDFRQSPRCQCPSFKHRLQVFSGPLVADLLQTERTVAALSGFDVSRFPTLPVVDAVNTECPTCASETPRVLTEGKIREHLLAEITRTESGDTIWMGQFYTWVTGL
jgi:hypothetical protein